MHYVFVYGTLKRGFPNHDDWMLENRFIANVLSHDRFPLVVGGKWFSPIMIAEKGSGQSISGELYEVNDEALAVLDRLESTHLANGYNRIAIKVVVEENEDMVEAWGYVKPRAAIDVIHDTLGSEYLLDDRYLHPSLR